MTNENNNLLHLGDRGLVVIGEIRTSFTQPSGTPIQPRYSGEARGSILIRPEYQEGLAGLEGFDRIWLLYWLDRAPAPRLTVTPFLDTHEHGIFATRSPARPNPIGLSCVRLLEVNGCELQIADVDMVDRTPLLDIKPYVQEFDAYAVQRCGWFDQRGPNPTTRADNRFSIEPAAEKDQR